MYHENGGLVAEGPRNNFSFCSKGRGCFSSSKHRPGSGLRWPLIHRLVRDSTSRLERLEREAEQSPPLNAEFKNLQTYTLTLLHFFLAWWLMKHKDNLYFSHEDRETSSLNMQINFYQNTRRHIPEVRIFYSHRQENLKSDSHCFRFRLRVNLSVIIAVRDTAGCHLVVVTTWSVSSWRETQHFNTSLPFKYCTLHMERVALHFSLPLL